MTNENLQNNYSTFAAKYDQLFDQEMYRSLMADYFVIADAASNRQVQAIVTEVKDKIQEAGGEVKLIEGFQAADWVLIDLGDVIVHVFSTEQRD
ncbi:ribosome silencing factor|uniref:Ribosome silencing factor n=1 Tax=Leuconostoc lactis TaxID=1246 RepID=A0A6L7A553_LEULA|nr:ribosome silencing factor [Leuconostoc lactis]